MADNARAVDFVEAAGGERRARRGKQASNTQAVIHKAHFSATTASSTSLRPKTAKTVEQQWTKVSRRQSNFPRPTRRLTSNAARGYDAGEAPATPRAGPRRRPSPPPPPRVTAPAAAGPPPWRANSGCSSRRRRPSRRSSSSQFQTASIGGVKADLEAQAKFGDKKLVVVTGTSSGLGRKTARALGDGQVPSSGRSETWTRWPWLPRSRTLMLTFTAMESPNSAV